VDAAAFVDHPSGFLALSSRNERFTHAGIPGFIAYRERGRHLVAFGGVHSLPSSRGPLLDRFVEHARGHGRRVIAVQVRESQVGLFRARGFSVNQLGTSFGLRLARFGLGGADKMQLRNKISRARRAGLGVVELGRDAPCDETIFAELSALSARWLRAKGHDELDFMIGELGDPDDSRRRIFAARDGSGRTVAFITYVPAWGETPGYLHDLTRRLPDAPAGAMELINAHALERMRAEGVAVLHFGFTPFIVGDAEPSGASRLAAWLIRELGRRGAMLYPAMSQACYKLKWGPDIVEREYLAARPLSIRGVIDLLRLTRSL
jgi:lysylphosphatidylglycerol synthetase-like protein (DUF2156 family)